MFDRNPDYEVRLPFDDILLPWALEHDPETARIIQAVQAKAEAIPTTSIRPQTPSPEARIPSQIDDLHPKGVIGSPEVCDDTLKPVDGRSRRRKYRNPLLHKTSFQKDLQASPDYIVPKQARGPKAAKSTTK